MPRNRSKTDSQTIVPDVQARLNILFPEIRAKHELIRRLSDSHILRECHVPRQLIDTRSLAIATAIVGECEDFRSLSELDRDIWAYAIAGYVSSMIRAWQRSKRMVH